MKTFKKITSMITALTMLSAMTVLPTSAVQTTEYTVSYDTLTQAIQTEDGSTVPAGSVAVTVSVSGNIGFDANTSTLILVKTTVFSLIWKAIRSLLRNMPLAMRW